MHFIFRKENVARAAEMVVPDEASTRPLWKNALFFAFARGNPDFCELGKACGIKWPLGPSLWRSGM
jgi:hypothetical protein